MAKSAIKDKAALLEDMVAMRDLLAERGIPVFLNFGTLLGALRERDFIAFDDDADMEIYERDEERFLALLPELESRGLSMFGHNVDQNLYKFRGRGEQLDLFVARERRTLLGRRVWDIEGRSSVPARHLDSLEELDFLGHSFKIPADPYALIRNLYGRNWRIPIEHFPARLNWSERVGKLFREPGKLAFYVRRFVGKRLGWARAARKAADSAGPRDK
jgi:lipopolysaccharide cholinephosphotransferase